MGPVMAKDSDEVVELSSCYSIQLAHGRHLRHLPGRTTLPTKYTNRCRLSSHQPSLTVPYIKRDVLNKSVGHAVFFMD